MRAFSVKLSNQPLGTSMIALRVVAANCGRAHSTRTITIKVQTATKGKDGSGWVNVPRKDGSIDLRTETPYTPSSRLTSAPKSAALERKPSNTADLIASSSEEGDHHDRALQPDEELRGAALQWAKEQAEGQGRQAEAAAQDDE